MTKKNKTMIDTLTLKSLNIRQQALWCVQFKFSLVFSNIYISTGQETLILLPVLDKYSFLDVKI